MRKLIILLVLLACCGVAMACEHCVENPGYKEFHSGEFKVIHHSSYPRDGVTVEAGEMYILKDKKTGKEYLYNTFKNRKSEFKEFIIPEKK